jgi:Outer membrane lipoprotein Slp family
MALCEGYLDPAVYSKGRQVTLAGRVLGTRTDMVGEIMYVYPHTRLPGGLSLAAYARYAYVVSLRVTGGHGTVHTGGSLIPSLASDRLWQPIRTLGGNYAVSLADRAREPTGLRGL